VLFGDKARFAIESVTAIDQPEPFGGLGPMVHLTYWVADQQIGDPDLPTYAGYLEEGLRHHLADRGHRRNDSLHARPAKDLATLLTDWPDAERATRERWSAHDIGQPLDRSEYAGDRHGDWAVHIVEDRRSGRVLAYSRAAPAGFIEAQTRPGEVDEALTQAWKAMQALLQPES